VRHRAGSREDDAPGTPLPLALRNRLAELILDAFDSAEALATLVAIERASIGGEATVDPADAERLRRLGWFESIESGRVRLAGAHRAHARALGDRAARGASAVAGWRDQGAQDMAGLLGRAASLADHGLFFEVHELLEPTWFRAAEPARTALQGLIQVAVAFHHLENRNHEGARSLLAEGVAKVAGSGVSLPLETAGWLGELRAALATLTAGRRPAVIPRWPRPRTDEEIRWRSC
jgi:hypothetical protein